jgi:hypothetical protein
VVWIGFIHTLYTPLWTTGNYSAIADLHTVTHTSVFSAFTSRILVPDFNTGTVTASLNHTLQISLYYSAHKYFSSMQDFQLPTEFSRLLHHLPSANFGKFSPILCCNCHLFSLIYAELKSNLMLRLTVSRPVSLGIKHPSRAYDQIFVTVRQLQTC